MIKENLKWTQDTMPSEILKQILDQESRSEDRTKNNVQALAFTYGKVLAMEELIKIED